MRRLQNIALESVTEKCDRRTDRWTDGRTDGQTDRRTTDKVIPMCRYASHATQKRKKITELLGVSEVLQIFQQNVIYIHLFLTKFMHLVLLDIQDIDIHVLEIDFISPAYN